MSTYQAVAGAGAAAVEGLRTETSAALVGRHEPSGTQKREIAFNAVPQVDVFVEDASTKEETKMANETRKILDAPEPRRECDLRARSHLLRPRHGHLGRVRAPRRNPAEAREAIATMPGVRVVDEPGGERYPTPPVDAAGNDDVLVGRIRADSSRPGGNRPLGRYRQAFRKRRRHQRHPDHRGWPTCRGLVRSRRFSIANSQPPPLG